MGVIRFAGRVAWVLHACCWYGRCTGVVWVLFEGFIDVLLGSCKYVMNVAGEPLPLPPPPPFVLA